jgi:hypothetical protein
MGRAVMSSHEALYKELVEATAGDESVNLQELESLARMASAMNSPQIIALAVVVEDARVRGVLMRHAGVDEEEEEDAVRRRFVRVDASVPVTVHAVFEHVRVPLEHGVLSDVSVNGAGVLMERPRSVGEDVALEFETGAEKVYLDARVVNVRPIGGGVFQVGFEFTDPSEEALSAISSFVSRRSSG